MSKQLEQKEPKLTNETACLEAWMREVTDALCYQPEIPMEHKKSIVQAFSFYRSAIGRPLRKHP